MKFRTEIEAKKSDLTLKPWLPIVMAGSCFSENIARIMRGCLWNAVNVSGTLYNPLSIASNLELFLISDDGERILENSLFEKDGVWKSWLFDSGMAADSPEQCLEEFNQRKIKIREALKIGETIIVTFGTNVFYAYKKLDLPVSNCHKLPSSEFEQKELTIERVKEIWFKLLDHIHLIYPELQIIFTISPVRYLKYGFEGNSLSKAILRLGIDEICRHFDFCHYFPAFEILNDDLRDYRFYSSDLVHPSEEAVEYIWEKFKETYLNEEGLELVKKGEIIVKGLDHKLKPSALRMIPEAIQKKEIQRLQALKSDYQSLLNRYPHLFSINS